MMIFYIAAGLNHFIHPEFYIKIMPPWIPYHKTMVLITGICEILFAAIGYYKGQQQPNNETLLVTTLQK